MIQKLLLCLLPLSVFASEVVWSEKSPSLSVSEQKKIIKEYVDKKYPQELQAYTQQQDIIIQKETTTVGGLMWQDNHACKTIKRDWNGAKQYCKNLSLVGFSDWYLPSHRELKSIVDKSRRPTIKKEFRNITSGSSFIEYWSSSFIYFENVVFAWGVRFRHGGSDSEVVSDENYVRCVRAVK